MMPPHFQWEKLMTRIIYNACYGGFNLSHDAKTYYCILIGSLTTDLDWWDICQDRSNPALLQVIDELGLAAASGLHAKLRIREIPAGTRYYIHEYDGMETIITEDEHEWEIA
jgi:hypothetical protein